MCRISVEGMDSLTQRIQICSLHKVRIKKNFHKICKNLCIKAELRKVRRTAELEVLTLQAFPHLQFLVVEFGLSSLTEGAN